MLIDNLTNLNRSTRNTIFTALTIIAAIAMYDWIVAPHVTCLFASQQYESVVSKAVEKNKVTAREVETKTKKLEELYRQLAESRSILFAPDEAKAFFSDLQAVAEEAGCTVNSLNLVANKPSSRDKRKTEDTSGITANSATLTVSGRYNSIFGLVEKLQNHAKKIWLDPFKIETINSDSAQLKCSMTITIYTIQDKGAAL
jgi:cell division protein ZapA (FtsZ GTPase activity inhibitor)